MAAIRPFACRRLATQLQRSGDGGCRGAHRAREALRMNGRGKSLSSFAAEEARSVIRLRWIRRARAWAHVQRAAAVERDDDAR
jgi:hypothetical protein